MHNLKEIRKDFSKFEKDLEKRSVKIDFNNLKKLDELNRDLIQKRENLEKEKKDISKSKDESLFKKSKEISIELEKDLNRVDNLLFAEGGSRIIFSISKMKQNEWFNYLKQNQINFPSSVYVKKIGYVSTDTLKIKINEKNICNIRLEELTEKFNNSISDYF